MVTWVLGSAEGIRQAIEIAVFLVGPIVGIAILAIHNERNCRRSEEAAKSYPFQPGPEAASSSVDGVVTPE